MTRLAIILLSALITLSVSTVEARRLHGGGVVARALTDEEFVGPFPSWMCARTAASGTCGTAATAFCNAVADGITNDATAIQTCLNNLATHPVLYFPCGTYAIATTLTITSQQAISLIGQDNSTAGGRCTTTFKWTGASGGKIINLDGIVYSQLSRITFDGNNLANILVDQAWNGSTGPFDTGNQYIDDVFKNGNDTTTSYGIRCGALGAGCSEVNVLRDTFNNLAFGIATCNANALDIWVWYSSFTNMMVAVGNDTSMFIGGTCGSGAVHAIGNVFANSSLADVYNFGGSSFNIIDNYSSGSLQFANVRANDTLQRNTIVDTHLGGTRQTESVYLSSDILLFDNTIENVNGALPLVGAEGSMVSIGNSFTSATPIDTGGRIYEYGDQTIAYAPPAAPTLPGVIPNNNRTIYDVAPGSTTAQIQAAICKASNGVSSTFSGGACTGSPDGLKSVAHISFGTYSISSTLVVPANSNAQIIGDGWGTILSSVTANPIVLVNGPSQVTMRAIHVTGNNNNTANDGLHINGVDQSGAYIYHRGGRYGGSTNGLVLNSVNNVLVNADNLQTPYDNPNGVGQLPVDKVQTGSNHFNQFLGTGGSFALTNGANALDIGTWTESSSFVVTNTVSGTGSFFYSTGLLNALSNNTFFVLSNFTGTFALLNMPITTAGSCPITAPIISATGTGTGGTIIASELVTETTTPISNSAGSTLLSASIFATGCVSDQFLTDVPNPFLTSNVQTLAMDLSYFRTTKPLLPAGKPSGISAIELYDIQADGFNVSIQISP